MLITRLQLTGFKSFVDTTELLIEPGLTGVVGPNGCGKSNLLEALRWVMGETSYKSMRASAMDDVIFSGTTVRPARNTAAVTITIDNAKRTAPPEFNDTDVVEISRRIERQSGSSYAVNGRETRARDVKILFEDAATGARSPALVRQGQIGEIVNARPENRRRILEDAAGIAGLRSRRHDAELRLKAAEANLERLGDVLGQMTAQIDTLRRQARQAKRYRELSDAIRRSEAAVLYLEWQAAADAVARAEADFETALAALASQTGTEAQAIAAEMALAERMPQLRSDETERAAAVVRLTAECETNARASAAAEAQRADLERQRETATDDIERSDEAVATAAVRRAEAEAGRADLLTRATTLKAQRDAAANDLAACRTRASDSDAQHAMLRNEAHALAVAVRTRETQVEERRAALARTEAALADVERDRARHAEQSGARREGAPDPAHLDALAAALRLAETDIETAQAEAAAAAAERETAQDAAREAALALRSLETEQATLTRLLETGRPSDAASVGDLIVVDAGVEAAVAAAFGDDLDAPLSEAIDETSLSDTAKTDVPADRAWHLIDAPETERTTANGDVPWPDGVTPLGQHIQAPEALARRIVHIGMCVADHGTALQQRLRPGQRLVSPQGDLWRWDGFVVRAGAPTSATIRLEQRNRLADIAVDYTEAEHAHTAAETARAAAQNRAEAAQAALQIAQTKRREMAEESARTSAAITADIQARAAHEARGTELTDRHARITAERDDARAALEAARADLTDQHTPDRLASSLAAAEAARAETRKAAEAAEAAHGEALREFALNEERSAALQREIARATADQTAADERRTALRSRADDLAAKLHEIADLPVTLAENATKLDAAIETAETARSDAADKLAAADTELREAQAARTQAQAAVVAAREHKARIETRLESARAALMDAGRAIHAALEATPDEARAISGLTDALLPPDLEAARAQLTKLRSDRERLGGVNLQAADELGTAEAAFAERDADRADVEAAVAKLRGGIGTLNREARKRLMTAFDSVNAQFASLFETLFGGGEARLELIDADDVLEGGLEIVAKPPGKKPTTLSLLSGGEQTLTALSLIFAVFLTNPSPICVLDEVDAPLDDANVERFCTLMENMTVRTETRFLVITHHPMTMARMHRLFGVTMAERGVSQLVSVDLAVAEQFLEAS